MGTDPLGSLRSTFTPREAVAAGIARHTVYRLRDAGVVEEISRGVYRKTNAPNSEYIDLIAVSKRAPRGIVCLISALAVHDLADEVPHAVQVAIPRGTNLPRIAYPPTEFAQFDAQTFELGRSTLWATADERVPVYSPERTLVDVMRTRYRWGDAVAFGALRTYLSRRSANPTELTKLARQIGGAGPLLHAMKVIMS